MNEIYARNQAMSNNKMRRLVLLVAAGAKWLFATLATAVSA